MFPGFEIHFTDFCVAQDAMIKSFENAPDDADEGADLDEAGMMETGEEEHGEDDTVEEGAFLFWRLFLIIG